MLTTELLKGIPALKDLSAEALQAIATLSANDENTVIAQKVQEIHTAYDADIKSITGKDKPGGVKTYDHLKTILRDYKEASEKGTGELQAKIDAITKEKADLEKKIKEGAGDKALGEKVEAMEKEVADKENRIKALQKQVDDEKTQAKAQAEKTQAEMIGLQFDFEFQRGLSGVKFKDEKEIPASVRDTFISTAMQAIKGKYKMDFMEKEGKKVPVFRDAQGMIVNNPKNLQNPFTPAEMLLAEIEPLLAAGHKQTGAGSGAGAGSGGSGNGTFAGGGYKNRVEATDALRKHLFANGHAAGTEEFQTAFNKEWADNKLSELPMK